AGRASGGPRSLSPRQLDDELRSFARPALHANRAAVRLDNSSRGPKADPEATVVAQGHGALEGPEDPLLVLGGDPDPMILHRQARHAVDRLDRPLDGTARSELHGVGEEVARRLAHALAVPHADDRSARVHRDRTTSAFELRLEAGDHVADHGGEIRRLAD